MFSTKYLIFIGTLMVIFMSGYKINGFEGFKKPTVHCNSTCDCSHQTADVAQVKGTETYEICIGGICQCPPGSKTLSYLFGDVIDPSSIVSVCEPLCIKNGDCDSKNHEVCVNGVCKCDSGFGRNSTLKCLPLTNRDKGCAKNQTYINMTCDIARGLYCGSPPLPDVSCSDSGLCCRNNKH